MPTLARVVKIYNMGKGDKPRNCFSNDYRDNYDQIDWGGSPERDLVNDCPTLYRWGTETPGVSTIEGMIRQSCDIPLEPQDQCGCDDQNGCCANE